MTDTFHLTQVFDFGKRTMRRTVLDHSLRQLGTNSRQCFQIGCGSMIQIDPPRLMGRGARAAHGPEVWAPPCGEA